MEQMTTGPKPKPIDPLAIQIIPKDETTQLKNEAFANEGNAIVGADNAAVTESKANNAILDGLFGGRNVHPKDAFRTLRSMLDAQVTQLEKKAMEEIAANPSDETAIFDRLESKIMEARENNAALNAEMIKRYEFSSSLPTRLAAVNADDEEAHSTHAANHQARITSQGFQSRVSRRQQDWRRQLRMCNSHCHTC